MQREPKHSSAGGFATGNSARQTTKSVIFGASATSAASRKKNCTGCGKPTTANRLFVKKFNSENGAFEILLCSECVDVLMNDMAKFLLDHYCEECEGRGFITQTGENYQHAVPCPLCKAREENY